MLSKPQCKDVDSGKDKEEISIRADLDVAFKEIISEKR